MCVKCYIKKLHSFNWNYYFVLQYSLKLWEPLEVLLSWPSISVSLSVGICALYRSWCQGTCSCTLSRCLILVYFACCGVSSPSKWKQRAGEDMCNMWWKHKPYSGSKKWINKERGGQKGKEELHEAENLPSGPQQNSIMLMLFFLPSFKPPLFLSLRSLVASLSLTPHLFASPLPSSFSCFLHTLWLICTFFPLLPLFSSSAGLLKLTLSNLCRPVFLNFGMKTYMSWSCQHSKVTFFHISKWELNKIHSSSESLACNQCREGYF